MHAFVHYLNLVQSRLAKSGLPWVALCFPVIAMLPSLIWLSRTDLSLNWDSYSSSAFQWMGMTTFVVWCAVRFQFHTLAGMIGGWTVILFAFASVSLPSVLPFFKAKHFWDTTFLAWDRALGLDHIALFMWLSTIPGAIEILEALYFYTVPLVLLTPVVLVLLGRSDRLHEFLWLFVTSLALVVAISAFVPAKGLFSALEMTAEVRSILPSVAGDYHLTLIDGLISGRASTYDITSNPGVIVFPSFHLCMAFLIFWAFRRIAFLEIAAAVAAFIIAISIVPIGGHYAVDGLASLVILAAAMVVYHARYRRSSTADRESLSGQTRVRAHQNIQHS